MDSGAELREWLAANHDSSDGVWLVVYKKETSGPYVGLAGDRRRAVRLRVDRQRPAALRRRALEAADHAAQGEEQLVADQQGEDRTADGGGPDGAGRARRWSSSPRRPGRGRRSTRSNGSRSPTTCGRRSTPSRTPAATGTASRPRPAGRSSSGSPRPSGRRPGRTGRRDRRAGGREPQRLRLAPAEGDRQAEALPASVSSAPAACRAARRNGAARSSTGGSPRPSRSRWPARSTSRSDRGNAPAAAPSMPRPPRPARAYG